MVVEKVNATVPELRGLSCSFFWYSHSASVLSHCIDDLCSGFCAASGTTMASAGISMPTVNRRMGNSIPALRLDGTMAVISQSLRPV